MTTSLRMRKMTKRVGVSNSKKTRYISYLTQNSKEMFFQGVKVQTHKTTLSDRQIGIQTFIESIGFQTCITILALFSLFSDDIRTAAFDGSADIYFDCIHVSLMLIFTV